MDVTIDGAIIIQAALEHFIITALLRTRNVMQENYTRYEENRRSLAESRSDEDEDDGAPKASSNKDAKFNPSLSAELLMAHSK